MFVFTGLCFIIGSVCMNFARINNLNKSIEQSPEIIENPARQDIEKGDEMKAVSSNTNKVGIVEES